MLSQNRYEFIFIQNRSENKKRFIIIVIDNKWINDVDIFLRYFKSFKKAQAEYQKHIRSYNKFKIFNKYVNDTFYCKNIRVEVCKHTKRL